MELQELGAEDAMMGAPFLAVEPIYVPPGIPNDSAENMAGNDPSKIPTPGTIQGDDEELKNMSPTRSFLCPAPG